MAKKILSLFLAVMMVVSLVPASVFAANGECPVLERYECHSKEHCTNAGVAYTAVPNGSVTAKCGQDGYTLYQCACGDYFADDIVDSVDHVTASGEPKTARVEPTCYSTGKIAVYTCDNCKEDYFKPEDLVPSDVDELGVIAKTSHTFDQVDYPNNSCLDSIQICENEGCTEQRKNPNAATEHNWKYDDPHAIVKAPTAHDEGLAVFKCVNEGCTKTKEVAVAALEHKTTMTAIEAKAPTCTEEGVIAHYLCAVCNKRYVERQGVMIEIGNWIIPIEHDWNEDPTIIEPTCTTWGFSYYGCPTCGAKKDFTEIKPLGHTAYDDELTTVKNHVAPDCETNGSYTWNCGRCGLAQTPVLDPKTDHAEVKIEIPATHKFGYKYTIVVCTNENCPKAMAKECVKTVGGVDVTFDVTVEVRDGNVYDLPETAEVRLVDVIDIEAVTTDLVHFFIEDKEVQAPNCTDPGKAFWYCDGDGCNFYDEEVLPATGHDYSDETNDIAATCTDNAVKICDVCSHREEQPNTAGHILSENKVAITYPTCQGEKGYDWYECTVCYAQVKDASSETTFVENKTYLGKEYQGVDAQFNLTAKEEFEAEHPGFTGTYEVYRQGDCVNNGYWKATCDDCDKTYLVLIDNTGKGHLVPAGTAYYEEADCFHGAGYATYTCDRDTCNAVVEAAAPLAHAMTPYAAVAATCTEGGNKAYWICSRECCEGVIYAKADGSAVYTNDEHLLDALDHNFQHTNVAVNCMTPGFDHHICTRCKIESVDGYIAPTGHTKAADPIIEQNTCTADGTETYLCENAGCTGDDGIAGNADDGIYSTRVLEKTGHKNAAGQPIVNICTDTTTDRVCVNEHCDPTELETVEGKVVVRKDHAEVEKEVEAGCEHYGYHMVTCANGCGEKDEIINLDPPKGHMAPWTDEAGEYVRIKSEDVATTIVNEDVVADLAEEFMETDPELYNGYITAYTAPTYEAMGEIKFTCGAHCGDELAVKVIRTGVDFIITADNAAVPGANTHDGAFYPVDGDVIAYEITLNAFETDVWGFNFDVEYNAASMNFLGYVFHAGNTFANYKINNILDDFIHYEDVNNDGVMEPIVVAEDVEGTIKVSAYTENGMDGTVKDAAITGTVKVVTLYFQVEAMVEYSYMGVKEVDFDYDVEVDMERYDENIQGYVSTITVVNSKGEVESSADWDYTEASVMLDTNYNGNVNITDLYNCNLILTGESDFEYLAAADANKDGKITITDLDLMNQLLQGADESEIYKALNWTAPEGFVAA